MQDFKKLTVKVFFLLLPLFIYYFGYNWYKIYNESFIADIDGGRIYKAIIKSHQTIESEIVIISDSYGGQLYPVENYDKSNNIFSLSTTAPSSLIGGYILLNNLSENNDLSGKKIIYIVGPNSLNNELNGVLTYNQFVKPFYTSDNSSYISEEAESNLRKIPYVNISQLPFIKCSDWSPDYIYKPSEGLMISDLYLEYLKKIVELGKKEGFLFKVVAPFIREDSRNADYTTIKTQIKESGLSLSFEGYFEDMKYKPVDDFFTGSGHYTTAYKYGLNPLGLK